MSSRDGERRQTRTSLPLAKAPAKAAVSQREAFSSGLRAIARRAASVHADKCMRIVFASSAIRLLSRMRDYLLSEKNLGCNCNGNIPGGGADNADLLPGAILPPAGMKRRFKSDARSRVFQPGEKNCSRWRLFAQPANINFSRRAKKTSKHARTHMYSPRD